MSISKDEISKLIGDHLLQGWTMLANICGTCEAVPLMRNREGKQICLGCINKENVEEEFISVPPEASNSSDKDESKKSKKKNKKDRKKEMKKSENSNGRVRYFDQNVEEPSKEEKRVHFAEKVPSSSLENPKKKSNHNESAKSVIIESIKAIESCFIPFDHTGNLRDYHDQAECLLVEVEGYLFLKKTLKINTKIPVEQKSFWEVKVNEMLQSVAQVICGANKNNAKLKLQIYKVLAEVISLFNTL